MINLPTLENKVLRSIDKYAHVMMPISGDAILLKEAKERIKKGENKIKIGLYYFGGIAFKYSVIGYVLGFHNFYDIPF